MMAMVQTFIQIDRKARRFFLSSGVAAVRAGGIELASVAAFKVYLIPH